MDKKSDCIGVNMATRKGRTPKLDDKKGKKSEDPTPVEDNKDVDDAATEGTVFGPTPDNDDLSGATETPQPAAEPVYDEPTLTELIVESYDGEKTKGLYEGDGGASFTGGHLYEGNFSEGLMHGKGKYTWANGIIYAGEFFRNQVTGKGVYTWPDGSSYDGDVVNGIRHGFGTFKTRDNRLSYTGEWMNGKRHGKGRINYDHNGNSYYEGDWCKNIRHGWGTRCYPSGNVYEGMWFNNIRHGEGTMRWLDRDEMYNGRWEDGIQHGIGQHIWFLHRVGGSQYALRNMYDGEFVRGLRDGYGVFYYANGAKYEGYWKDNMKEGKGKFVFKNGRIFEGNFEKDHITEFPSFTMDGVNTPDISMIRTRTPLPTDAMSVHSNASKNTMSPSFQLDIDALLQELIDRDQEEEGKQVMYVVMRHMTDLRKIYNFYSALGYDASPDNTFIMIRMQHWRFLKDCKIHHHDISLTEMDRLTNTEVDVMNLHNPNQQILFREFLNYLVILAYHIYHEEHSGPDPLLAWCFSKLVADNILPHACCVNGYFYHETRRAVHALVHLPQAFEVYMTLCTSRKHIPHEPVLKMRDFLFMLQDYKLVNEDLSPKGVIDILASDNPGVCDEEGAINLELEMTFLEFFEALVGCSECYVTESVVKDPSTPRPSTILTREQSMMSIPMSPSRAASQGDLNHDDATGNLTPQPSITPALSTPGPRALSSAGTTHKTADGGKTDGHPSVSGHLPAGSEIHAGASSQHTTTHGSARQAQSEIGADAKKSASFEGQSVAGDEQDGMVRSMASMAQSDAISDIDESIQDEEEGEGLDEETRQFNFWTHQVHIFFVRKFFTIAQKIAILKSMVAKSMIEKQRQVELDARKAEAEAALASERAAAAAEEAFTTGTEADDSGSGIEKVLSPDGSKTDNPEIIVES